MGIYEVLNLDTLWVLTIILGENKQPVFKNLSLICLMFFFLKHPQMENQYITILF